MLDKLDCGTHIKSIEFSVTHQIMFIFRWPTCIVLILGSRSGHSFHAEFQARQSIQKGDIITMHLSDSKTEFVLSTTESKDNTDITFTFTTPPMQVYIEDTDAYGIMYNSNYLRSFDRALHMTTTKHKLSNSNSNDRNSASLSHPISGQHEGWSIVSVGNQRFAASPRLGEEFAIQGRLQQRDDNQELWDMQLQSLDGSIVYNTVKDLKIQVADDDSVSLHSSLSDIPPFDMASLQPNFVGDQDLFTVYRDEIDAHWQGHLPLRNVLNLFERSRTNALGGPEGLRRLQEDPNNPIIVVVTGISELTLVDEGIVLVPGQVVAVETAMVVKRKGMVLECYQTLKSTLSSARLAQGKVSLMMLDAKSRRPTAKVPMWVKELLHI